MGFVGWGGLEASQNGNVSGSVPTGMVASIGGGYEFWIANEWSIGPLARLTYAPLSHNGVDFNTTAFAVAADFKFH
jgi:outer membrane autotransporter protein